MSGRGARIGAMLAALALALALAGCVSGPDYRVPATALAAAPRAGRAFVAGEDPAYAPGALPDRWWRLYADPQLDAYVAEALQANADLRAADANLRRASAHLREASAGASLRTEIDASVTLAHAGGITTAASPQAYALGLGLSYPLDLAGGLRRGIEAASADAAAEAAVRDQVRVAVAAAVARAYVGACSANQTLAATQRVLQTQRATLEATRRLAAGGRATAFDVSRARAALNQSAAALPQRLAERQAALFALATLMGRLPADSPSEVAACQQPPRLRDPIPVGDGWALLRRRADVRAAERRLAAATATIGVETAQLYPQVRIGASAGVANALHQRVSADSVGGAIGPLLSWSWPNRRVARARIDAAGANADAALASFDGAVLDALRQTETALSAYAREAAVSLRQERLPRRAVGRGRAGRCRIGAGGVARATGRSPGGSVSGARRRLVGTRDASRSIDAHAGRGPASPPVSKGRCRDQPPRRIRRAPGL